MQGITEEEYAMKFCMLIILDERKVSGMDKYAENFKYILESYKKVIVNHLGLVIENPSLEEGSDEFKNQVHMLTELCKVGNIGLNESEVTRQDILADEVFYYDAQEGRLISGKEQTKRSRRLIISSAGNELGESLERIDA